MRTKSEKKNLNKMLRDKIERKKNQEKDKNPIIKRMSTKFNIKTKKIKCKWMNRKKK
jgi:predicted solute-binding protein